MVYNIVFPNLDDVSELRTLQLLQSIDKFRFSIVIIIRRIKKILHNILSSLGSVVTVCMGQYGGSMYIRQCDVGWGPSAILDPQVVAGLHVPTPDIGSLTHTLSLSLLYLHTDQRQLSWEASLQATAHANRDEEDRYSTAWK